MGKEEERWDANKKTEQTTDFHADAVLILFWVGEWGGYGGNDRQEKDDASDVGDGTFAAFLHGYVHIGGGDVAFLSALLPRSGPAVAFVLLYDVQHLETEVEMLDESFQNSLFYCHLKIQKN